MHDLINVLDFLGFPFWTAFAVDDGEDDGGGETADAGEEVGWFLEDIKDDLC